MKRFSIQLQFTSDESKFCRDLLATELLKVLSTSAQIVRETEASVDGFFYITATIQPNVARDFWHDFQPTLQALSDKLIVVCEGDHGWDDYLLLHHFSSEEKLEILPES